MSDDPETPGETPGETPVGAIGWFDLAVPDAAPVRDFYAGVVGWTPAPGPGGTGAGALV